ncbi:hypothetical protein K8T06_01195, partial [bacterium]|nr:hypothetical protein [bacterium]
TLRCGVFSWLDLGAGYAVDADDYVWSLRIQPVTQDLDGWRPAVIIGTGSVSIGGYATDIPDVKEHWGLGTFSMTLFDRVSPFYTYDGENFHVGLSVFVVDWLTITGHYLEMETAAVSVSLKWDFSGSDK